MANGASDRQSQREGGLEEVRLSLRRAMSQVLYHPLEQETWQKKKKKVQNNRQSSRFKVHDLAKVHSAKKLRYQEEYCRTDRCNTARSVGTLLTLSLNAFGLNVQTHCYVRM